MTEVVSIRFRGSCKIYYFAPEGIECRSGDTLIVETAKGLEMVECCMGNHEVEDEEVVQPLKRVIRIATSTDKENAEKNRAKEGDALEICRQKVADHGLDMKLVGAEYSFDGTKTTFFFTSDGRVDFRELVKDLAAVFHNRIELRQIGVRDEAKMVGGLGICGRPYCCKAFMDDFAPVSTKMAKTQNLSLNPTKISGSCGRLMCCLRYEQDAYEDLIKRIPKAGTFVETKDGFGTVEQADILRSMVKVRLDTDSDDKLRIYKSNELCAVPGGRPPEGEEPQHVFEYVPEEEKDDEKEAPKWEARVIVSPEEQEKSKTAVKNSDSSDDIAEDPLEDARKERRRNSGRPHRRTGNYKRRTGKRTKEQQS